MHVNPIVDFDQQKFDKISIVLNVSISIHAKVCGNILCFFAATKF